MSVVVQIDGSTVTSPQTITAAGAHTLTVAGGSIVATIGCTGAGATGNANVTTHGGGGGCGGGYSEADSLTVSAGSYSFQVGTANGSQGSSSPGTADTYWNDHTQAWATGGYANNSGTTGQTAVGADKCGTTYGRSGGPGGNNANTHGGAGGGGGEAAAGTQPGAGRNGSFTISWTTAGPSFNAAWAANCNQAL
jgi:hypothetical protein